MNLQEFLKTNNLKFVDSNFPAVTHPGEIAHACLLDENTGMKIYGKTQADAIYSYLTRETKNEG